MQQTLFCLSIFVVIATLIPFIRHDYWIFRVFEYPRLQKLVLNFLLIVISLWFWPVESHQLIGFVLLVVNLVYLVYLVLPFTIFGVKQIVSSTKPEGENNISLLVANVYQDNRESEKYLKLIEQCNPDIVLMVETNLWWQQQMDKIGEGYPHQLKMPLENTYGMIFYSRLELRNGSINFLVEDDIPSIQVEVKLNSGQWLRLYCLHPEPPVPQENPRSTERDKEILMVAKMAKECELPVIVMGDLNDVAWSYTTELFGKVSGLLDPRRGRGFFNSFNAKYFFLRFPLDHIFCSADFTLSGIKRMNSCGSDHFPMCINFQYSPGLKKLNNEPVADAADIELAEEKINVETEIR
ncbi:endonuclease/exonuclease/phosphatase family protein [Pedobacter duraquae]|uniref:Endonuclease/exonuclease/phosphatase (EEP) superfamily protein YafD n=1 Tax=Pedobacter duraquae TaxID=425511 RepID=A0A4R6IEY7_9SPHI|nr:endonuclease/exonuclease/phosphatase family protein [Pedobacter duraquae]TDO20883.1 endonuclease/exonuclease/phosphatase (EEP) superfamily protein YafD [Pedobacter duraquae]